MVKDWFTRLDSMSGEPVSINPVQRRQWQLLRLGNDEEQHGLWATFGNVPTGWRVMYGEADRAACVDYIEQHWTDIRLKNLREMLAAGRASDN
jgi:MbtH protein/glycopeptidolipid biosynthesis protein